MILSDQSTKRYFSFSAEKPHSRQRKGANMPLSVNRMISDLYHRRAIGIFGGGFVMSRGFEQDGVLNQASRVQKYATPVTLSADTDRFRVVRGARNDTNAYYLGFVDGMSTIATLTRHHRIVVGGGYSGCLYSVYHDGRGSYKCVHTARPGGANADTYVGLLRAYAATNGWTLVHEIPTVTDAVSGVGINGCRTTFLATRVSYTINPRPVVRTVRLRQDSQGNSVHQARWETPTP